MSSLSSSMCSFKILVNPDILQRDFLAEVNLKEIASELPFPFFFLALLLYWVSLQNLQTHSSSSFCLHFQIPNSANCSLQSQFPSVRCLAHRNAPFLLWISPFLTLFPKSGKNGRFWIRARVFSANQAALFLARGRFAILEFPSFSNPSFSLEKSEEKLLVILWKFKKRVSSKKKSLIFREFEILFR